MKIALVIYAIDRFGGAERRICRIYNSICNNEEFSSEFIFRGCKKADAVRMLNESNCGYQNISAVRCFSNNTECLLYFIRHHKYDAVHYFDTSGFNYFLQVILWMLKIPTIFSICNFSDAYGLSSVDVMKKVDQQAKLANIIDLLYPSGLETFRNRKYFNKIRITPGTFTDLDVFFPKKKEKLMIYAAARLNKQKNASLLIEAVSICQNEIKEKGYKISLLGLGEEKELLEGLVNEYALSDIIRFEGYKKTSEYYPSSEVAFSLQRGENYPSQCLAEASASGCYLIITDVGDSRKCAEETFSSFIKDDKSELANAIIEYMNFSDEKKEQIVKIARDYAEKNYVIDRSKDYFRKLLIQITNGRGI